MAETDKKDAKISEEKLDDPAVKAAPESTSSSASSDFFSYKEAVATGETYRLTTEEVKRRNKRSLAIAGGVVVFMVLVFAITVLRIGAASAGA